MQVYGEDVLMTFCESHADLRKSAERWLRAVVGLIKTDEGLHAALQEFGAMMELGSDRRSPYQEDRYDLLGLVIRRYESQKYPRIDPDPVDMIEFFMDQHNLRRRDMVEYFGSPSRTSEVLNYKRKLTLKMMRKLHEGLGIPLEILVRDYELKNEVRNK